MAALRRLGLDIAPGSGAELAVHTALAVALNAIVLVIVVGVHIGGLRQAVTGTGLFGPTGTARLLLRHRALSGRLFLDEGLLALVEAVTVGLGTVALVLPSLGLLVVCALALWYLVAAYGLAVGIHQSGAIPAGGLGHGRLRTPLRRRA